MTVTEYAEVHGTTRQTILTKLADGRLVGEKTADGWIVYGTVEEFPPAGTIAEDRDNSPEKVRQFGRAVYTGEVYRLEEKMRYISLVRSEGKPKDD